MTNGRPHSFQTFGIKHKIFTPRAGLSPRRIIVHCIWISGQGTKNVCHLLFNRKPDGYADLGPNAGLEIFEPLNDLLYGCLSRYRMDIVSAMWSRPTLSNYRSTKAGRIPRPIRIVPHRASRKRWTDVCNWNRGVCPTSTERISSQLMPIAGGCSPEEERCGKPYQ